LGILNVLASRDFPETDLVGSPPVSAKVNYGELATGINQCQENYRKYLSVVKGKGSTVMRSRDSICLPSIAPVQLGKCHSEQNSAAISIHSSSVGCGNTIGSNLFQIASQVDVIIERTVESAIL
jgi:hypothetical protein